MSGDREHQAGQDESAFSVDAIHDPVLEIRIYKSYLTFHGATVPQSRDQRIQSSIFRTLLVLLTVFSFPLILSCLSTFLYGLDDAIVILLILAAVVLAFIFGAFLTRFDRNPGYAAKLAKVRRDHGLDVITSGTVRIDGDSVRLQAGTHGRWFGLDSVRHVALQFNAVIVLIRLDDQVTAIGIHRKSFQDDDHLRRFAQELLQRLDEHGRKFAVKDHPPCSSCGYDLHGMGLRCTECGEPIPLQWSN